MGADIENVNLCGADVYVEGIFAGATVGPVTVKYTPTLRPYFGGYPACLRGQEITAAGFSLHIPYICITPGNVKKSIADGIGQTVLTNDYIKFATKQQPNTFADVVLHKYNPGNKKHLIVRIWKAQISSEFALEYEQESGSFVQIGVDFTALFDSSHPACPLGFIDFATTFDINHLPTGPTNG